MTQEIVEQSKAVDTPAVAANAAGSGGAGAAAAAPKKICCACPDTKKLRDECIAEHGEDACRKWIDVHLRCLREEGFNV